MKKEKCILFDWGGVVESMKDGYTNPMVWNDTLKACGYQGDNFYEYVIKSPELTVIPNDQELEKRYNQIKEEYHLEKNYSEFKTIYHKNFSNVTTYPEMIALEHSLKEKCKIGVLSNLLAIDWDRINHQLDLEQYDYCFLSYELGYMKPQKEIYEEVLKRIPMSPENVLLIDDKKENIEAAIECGMKGIQATGTEIEFIKEGIQTFLEE